MTESCKLPILDIWSHFFVSILLLYYRGGNGKESEPEVLQIWLKAQKWPTMTFGAIFSIFLHLHLGIVYVGGGMVEEVDVEAFRCD